MQPWCPSFTLRFFSPEDCGQAGSRGSVLCHLLHLMCTTPVDFHLCCLHRPHWPLPRNPPSKPSLQPATPSIFTFGLEDRVQCATTGAVSYRPSTSTALSLHIPLEAAANAGEVAAYQERQAKRQKLEAEQVGCVFARVCVCVWGGGRCEGQADQGSHVCWGQQGGP